MATICTLFEGNYHFGLAALVNSLSRSGFTGVIYAGCRGALPPWATPKLSSANRLSVTSEIEIQFIALDTQLSLSNYKPTFILDIATKYAADAPSLFYFDPDIVVYCAWAYFERWVAAGVALCADVNWIVPNDHPMRNSWRAHFAEHRISLDQRRDIYFNAGFIGMRREHLEFVRDWQQLHATVASRHHIFSDCDPTALFAIPDQDTLNATTMRSRVPISTVGPDGMEFEIGRGSYIMAHAVGTRKPWSHSFTAEVLRGRRMSRPCRSYLEVLRQPISPHSTARLALLRLDAFVARVLGRLIA